MDEGRYLIWAALAGAFIPVMAVVNGKLGRSLGDPLYAVLILFAIAFLVFSVAAFIWGRVPLHLSALQAAEPVHFIGGLIVGFYVLSATLLAPRMGVAHFIMMAVSAQMMSSVVIDHWGLFGAAVRPLTLTRLVGVVILIAGVVVIQMAETTPTSSD